MEKAYKFRIYPNKIQRELLAQTFGNCRFVYNYFLAKKQKLYADSKESMSYNKCSAELTKLKKEFEWLCTSDKFALQNALRDLDTAYTNFFKKKANYPKFKSKKTHRYSYRTTYTNNNIEFLGKHIKLPKLGYVKIRDKLVPQGRIVNATISQKPSGKYYCSICCTDVEIESMPKTGALVGIDLGIKDFAITSDGIKIENPKYLGKSLDKLAKLQRELSRKTKGGSNWNKARVKVARMNEKITNQRKDFLQKTSTQLIRDYDIICLENLKVKDMLQNKDLARNISDVSWSEFNRMLDYKAKWYGKEISRIDQYYPSSQLCHCCGYQNKDTKDLNVREWICPQCGIHHDRDVNAAMNILQEGLRIL